MAMHSLLFKEWSFDVAVWVRLAAMPKKNLFLKEVESMFNAIAARLRQEINTLRQDRLRRQALVASVEEVVDIADPIIRLAHRWRKVLLPSVERTIGYCERMITSLPGPVRLNRKNYHDDPLVKALFRSIEEMETVVQQARNVAGPGGGQDLFALLTMTKTETIIYGHKQQGEMILADVPMKAVTFVDHRAVAPTLDLQTTMRDLQQRSLAILAGVAMENIASRKANLTELRERRARLSSMNRILRGKRQTFEFFAQPEQENAEKLRELQALLSQTEQEIELAKKEIETPDDALGYLKRVMDSPEETLVFREKSLRLNWMNVVVEASEEPFHQLNLAELTLNDELQRFAVLVCFDR
jgi:hypothetical protein